MDYIDLYISPAASNRLTKESTMKYFIKDWAGNVLFDGKTFNSFEDGWDFLYVHFADVPEKDTSDGFFDDFYVERVTHA